jgi:hypothetical protein
MKIREWRGSGVWIRVHHGEGIVTFRKQGRWRLDGAGDGILIQQDTIPRFLYKYFQEQENWYV